MNTTTRCGALCSSVFGLHLLLFITETSCEQKHCYQRNEEGKKKTNHNNICWDRWGNAPISVLNKIQFVLVLMYSREKINILILIKHNNIYNVIYTSPNKSQSCLNSSIIHTVQTQHETGQFNWGSAHTGSSQDRKQLISLELPNFRGKIYLIISFTTVRLI